ncbi:MAG: RraA family protein [Bacteroidales bacterium]|nr:RraA family protein [Bacteroidales bacterium]
MDIRNQIIDKIKRNRISTTEIADCMNKSGDIPDVYALNRGHFTVGRVFWVYAYNESNWEVHEQLRNIQEGDIALVDTFNCGRRAVFGHLVSKFLMLYRQVSAIVVRGYLRDVPNLLKENWPIWLEGETPIGCFNRKNDIPFDRDIIETRQQLYMDAIAVCDDAGVVVIPKQIQDKEFLDKLDWIEEQEDTWYDCVDRLKWDTYDTVCLKKYHKKNDINSIS